MATKMISKKLGKLNVNIVASSDITRLTNSFVLFRRKRYRLNRA